MEYLNETFDMFNHFIRVGNLSYHVAKELGYKDCVCKEIFMAGLLHDVGKLKLDANILHKKDKLTPEEFEHIKVHVNYSAAMLKKLPLSEFIITSIVQHHENVSGGGYPNGLSGDSIIYGAKIIKACDVFDALITNRPYREKHMINQAVNTMLEEKHKYDDYVLKALFKTIKVVDLNDSFGYSQYAI
jgi:putative nucleotidyltransferase with HDIG domain